MKPRSSIMKLKSNNEIIHYISHEVRKPIANIVGVVNVFQKNGFTNSERIECKKKLELLLGDLDQALSIMEKRYGNSKY